MIAMLIEKEFRQHGSMVLLFWLFIGAGLFLMKINDDLSSAGGSDFYLVSWILFLLFPLACLVLGNSLIATEFRQKTQIFLDGLPLPRWKMIFVKYSWGLAVALLTALMPLSMAMISGWEKEALAGPFLRLLLLKTVLWAWFAWAGIFLFSLLGRYRMIVGLTIVLGLMFLENLGNVPVTRFGPFELIGDQFPYERMEVPTAAIWITVGLIALLTTAGFALSLVRDATLATLLSEKMSTREKVVMLALGLMGLMIGGSLAERAEQTDPLDLPDSVDIVQSGVSVSVAAAVMEPSTDERSAMQQHAQSAATLVREVGQFLKIEQFPPLFLIHRRDLDSSEFETGDLDSRQGCLIRLNVLKTPATDPVLHSYIVEKLLDANQHHRLSSDRRGWILEGFAYWWPRRALDDSNLATPPTVTSSGADQATTTEPMTMVSVTTADVLRWKKFRQSLPATKVGWFAAQNIGALWTKDQHRCREFLIHTLGYSAPHDGRATLHDWWYDVPTVVRNQLHMEMHELVEQWNRAAGASTQAQESLTP